MLADVSGVMERDVGCRTFEVEGWLDGRPVAFDEDHENVGAAVLEPKPPPIISFC